MRGHAFFFYERMSTTSLYPLLFAVLLHTGLGRPHVPACKFSIPATNASGSCDFYDLSTVAGEGPRFLSSANHSYVFSLCENVPSSSVPDVCKNVSESVAYQYTSKTCYSIGNLDSTYVVRMTLFFHAYRDHCTYYIDTAAQILDKPVCYVHCCN